MADQFDIDAMTQSDWFKGLPQDQQQEKLRLAQAHNAGLVDATQGRVNRAFGAWRRAEEYLPTPLRKASKFLLPQSPMEATTMAADVATSAALHALVPEAAFPADVYKGIKWARRGARLGADILGAREGAYLEGKPKGEGTLYGTAFAGVSGLGRKASKWIAGTKLAREDVSRMVGAIKKSIPLLADLQSNMKSVHRILRSKMPDFEGQGVIGKALKATKGSIGQIFQGQPMIAPSMIGADGTTVVSHIPAGELTFEKADRELTLMHRMAYSLAGEPGGAAKGISLREQAHTALEEIAAQIWDKSPEHSERYMDERQQMRMMTHLFHLLNLPDMVDQKIKGISFGKLRDVLRNDQFWRGEFEKSPRGQRILDAIFRNQDPLGGDIAGSIPFGLSAHVGPGHVAPRVYERGGTLMPHMPQYLGAEPSPYSGSAAGYGFGQILDLLRQGVPQPPPATRPPAALQGE